MAKTLNKDQIAMLDKEVQKLDKKLDNKDMEKAMGMLMKKVGIKESDLDELSLSMKQMTKSGINKNVGIDKDKLKMGLKDLRKKLDKDKKKAEANIVRSKKGIASLRRKSAEENPKIRKEAQVNEFVPLIPAAGAAIGTVARMAAPHVARAAAKVAPKVAKAVKNVATGTAKTVAKNPVKSTAVGTAAALSTKTGQQAAKSAAGSLAKKALGSTAGKVALGVGGAYAAKKAYDKVKSNQAKREAEKRRQAQRQNDVQI